MHMESFGLDRTFKITETDHKPNVMPIKAQNAYLETSQVLRIFFLWIWGFFIYLKQNETTAITCKAGRKGMLYRIHWSMHFFQA